jgi:hypothetical protein
METVIICRKKSGSLRVPHADLAASGLKTLEPGPYATGFSSQSSLKLATGIDAYVETRAQVFAGGANTEFGDPAATSASLFKVVDSEQPPLRFFLGTEGLPVARAAYAERLAVWESWEDASNAAQGQPKKQALDL